MGLVLGLPLFVFVLWLTTPRSTTSFVEIGNVRVNVQIASTTEEQIQGLSNKEYLPSDEGLLFVYDRSGFHSFWMKDMNFPIDIIWIGDGRHVVDVTENLAPETYPETFSPADPAQYVLEVNAGYVQENNIEKGDKVLINFDSSTLIKQ